ncbi:Nodal modulator 1 [Halotydeus destructor]|nr:Nodal modulator 1 [Halotydeus destructor]
MQLRNPLRFNCSLLCVLLLTLSNYCQANDILGCGGFVKSPVNIDYSKVSIKLYTASGSLKESTDCAPNNGYYFLPLEGKGDHVLRVEPPEGWVFEPNEVTIKIDGQSDPCSRGEDVNFIFKGFSISGKVLSNGLLSGPSGVTVSLKDKKTNQLIKSLVTGVHGDYSFEEVLPGLYEVSASHPKWQFKGKNSLLVKVHEENVVLNPEIISEAITIQGFDVSGAVEGDGEAIKGVQFGLFSRIKGLNPKDIGNCNEASIPYKNQPNNGLNYLCHAVSGADGTFSFKSLPPGDYKLVPFYKGSSIQFDVKPAEVDFVVKHDSVNLQPTFQVEGFGISGRILGRANGQGVANAEVLLTSKTTGTKKARTDGNGVYYIDNVRAGTYTLEVNSENRKFESLTIKISPSSSKVPDVHVAAFRVCGKVNFVSPSLGNRVRFGSNHGPDVLTDIGSDGSFCTFLKSGTYKITPEGRADDLMTFKPASVDVKLAESPILDVKFDQFAAKISGKVSLIGNEFEKLTIRLSRENGGQESTWTATQGQNWNTFEFSHVVNGKYKLTISKDHTSSADWCWENDQLDVVVNGADVTGLTFKQKGFVGIFQTSHLVNLKLRSPSGRSEELKVNRLHKHCLPEAGVYTVEPVSCHKFKLETEDATPEVFMLDTNSKSELKLSAAKHKLDIVVNSKENVTDLVLVISLESSNGKVSQKTINLVQNRDGAAADNYRASLYVEPETDVHVTATSSSLLLKPPNHSVRIQNECPRELLFTGKAGLFVRGSVRPALEGVEITIKQTNAEGDVSL